MKRVLLTGIHGAVAYAMKKELDDKYEVSGLSVARMDDVLRDFRASSWKEQLDTFRDKLMDQLTTAFRGKDAVAHLGSILLTQLLQPTEIVLNTGAKVIQYSFKTKIISCPFL